MMMARGWINMRSKNNIKSVRIPESVTSISGLQFENNSGNSMGWYAFFGCTALTDLTCFVDSTANA